MRPCLSTDLRTGGRGAGGRQRRANGEDVINFLHNHLLFSCGVIDANPRRATQHGVQPTEREPMFAELRLYLHPESERDERLEEDAPRDDAVLLEEIGIPRKISDQLCTRK